MRPRSSIVIVAIVLGVLAIIMSFAASLALMDIGDGKEPDLTLEWTFVWAALMVIVIAQTLSIVTILTLKFRHGSEKDTDHHT